MAAIVIYGLCACTAIVCAILLLHSYWRSGYRLLLWSGLCFVGLSMNNFFLILDKLVFPNIDFAMWRTSAALIAMMILLYGLIWDAQ